MKFWQVIKWSEYILIPLILGCRLRIWNQIYAILLWEKYPKFRSDQYFWHQITFKAEEKSEFQNILKDLSEQELYLSFLVDALVYKLMELQSFQFQVTLVTPGTWPLTCHFDKSWSSRSCKTINTLKISLRYSPHLRRYWPLNVLVVHKHEYRGTIQSLIVTSSLASSV